MRHLGARDGSVEQIDVVHEPKSLQSEKYPTEGNPMQSASHSSESSSASSVTPLLRLPSGETCAYTRLSSSTGCRPPRSCRSCLETIGCMVDTVGSCVNTLDEPYDPRLDYRRAIEEGLVVPNATTDRGSSQMWQFPAGVVRYCSDSDAVCRQCKLSNFGRSRYSLPDSRFCLGEDGCVCADVCERRWFVQADCSSRNAQAPAPTSARVGSLASPDPSNTIIGVMVGSAVFFIVALGCILRARRSRNYQALAESAERRRQQELRRQERRRARSTALGVSQLTLSGWETYRRDLLDKEAARLASGTETSSSSETNGSRGSDHGNDDDPDCHTQVVTTEYARLEDPAHPAGVEATTEATQVEAPRPSLLAPLSSVRQTPINR